MLEVNVAEFKSQLKIMVKALDLKAEDECLLTAQAGHGLYIEGFKDGTYLRSLVSATVHQEFEVSVKPLYLTSLKLNGDIVVLSLQNTWLHFQCGRFKGHVETSQDMARLKAGRPQEEIFTPYNLASDDLIGCMKRAYLQPSVASQTYGIKCQLVANTQGVMSLVLSSMESGVRAVLVKKQIPQTIQLEQGASPMVLDVMLPPTVWNIINKLKGPIQIGTNGKIFRLYSGYIDLYQPLLAFQFQDIETWLTHLPDQHACRFQVDAGQLKTTIDQAASVAVTIGGNSAAVGLKCAVNGNELHTSVSAMTGEATNDIQVINDDGKDVNFAVTAQYITESLSLIGNESVEVKIWKNPKAVLVCSGPSQAQIDAETDLEKQSQLLHQMRTFYIIPQESKSEAQ